VIEIVTASGITLSALAQSRRPALALAPAPEPERCSLSQGSSEPTCGVKACAMPAFCADTSTNS